MESRWDSWARAGLGAGHRGEDDRGGEEVGGSTGVAGPGATAARELIATPKLTSRGRAPPGCAQDHEAIAQRAVRGVVGRRRFNLHNPYFLMALSRRGEPAQEIEINLRRSFGEKTQQCPRDDGDQRHRQKKLQQCFPESIERRVHSSSPCSCPLALALGAFLKIPSIATVSGRSTGWPLRSSSIVRIWIFGYFFCHVLLS